MKTNYFQLIAAVALIFTPIAGRCKQILLDVNMHAFRKQNTPTYEADVEQKRDGFLIRAQLLCDRGKFCEGLIYPSAPQNKPPDWLVLFDGSKPYITWNCGISTKTAWPDLSPIYNALSEEEKRDGESIVRKRYHLPAGFHFFVLMDSELPPRPLMDLVNTASLEHNLGNPVGHEKVAGYMCDVYENRLSRGAPETDGRPATGTETQSVRLWVEPRTNPILKSVEQIEPTGRSQRPPSSTTFIVKRLIFPKHINDRRFQLPPGTSAHFPLLFKSTKLPKSVIRVPETGPAAEIGIDVHLAH